ncbi:chlorophyll A-B binding protein [Aureococcus anophagefferens]|uniref:Chlorophyll A-B binding protein n=1 Tax=Aureococcus anophagefferens TaxID=44056 RepID=A0ABR1G0F3_AURAN
MEMAGIGLETGGQIWDPAGFATFSDESLTWCGAASRAIARAARRLRFPARRRRDPASRFRACELKHGRVAMLASAGWIANGLHLAWPGTIDYTTPFSTLAALPPLEAWEKVPLGGKLQILAWAFCVELYSEMQKPHYLKGGDFNAELKNGRLAMIGILGFFASANIPGAVPMVPH